MEKFFKLREKGTNVKTEVIAGITTFMTMAYILAVNPNILSAAGMDRGAVLSATALASAIGSICMGIFANLPFVLSAGMGLNAYFAYTVVIGMGYHWQVALAAVFIEGLIFILLSLTNVREAIFNAIPATLKLAVSVGIGLFIAFIGLQNASIVVDSATLVTIFSFTKPSDALMTPEYFTSLRVTVVLALLGILITGFLIIRNIKGNILIGIVSTWLLGIICQIAGLYKPCSYTDASGAVHTLCSLIPNGLVSMPSSIAPTFMQMDFSSLLSGGFLNFIVIMFAFLFVDIFDTLGTIIGCATKANMLDKDGKLPNIKGALLADAVGTTVGACLGTSTITTFVESSSGVSEGGRSGLTSVVSAILFLLSLFFSPLFLTIPSFATAPALILVGFYMMQQVGKIAWNDFQEAIPAFITIMAMAFLYSISEGICFGIISYCVLNLLTGRGKKISPLMYVLSVIFILKYCLL